ncbi:putative protease [Desulfocicer vacuolatum DSM 3385]|uniref:Putative protease n=1 Tax=Desulfocicer vacuolatum DSM 3385 TaxID=1121400 RepID=A0A1W2ED85_9BACT|nr:peptidase U32 family protein [Desulfocicer vacuolatum]SMD07714.1 putative protease [Desulfocicer vacuolatum DSM 3385]
MKREIELLAPGGDLDSIKAAIAAGADAVYCGLINFNARTRAANINFEDLNGILNLAHGNNCKVFLTLNIIIVGSEFPALIKLLNKLVNTKIDGVIIQDLGLFYLLSRYFKNLEIHASTQLNTHNKGQIKFLSKLTASRVNLSRELNIDQIKSLTLVGQQHNILTEVFVHGSYCISFSGICYLSSVHGGRSGNRGRCSQPCRDRYLTTSEGKNFPLNLKDNSAYFDLQKISDAGVASIKIEGRIKKSDYVYTVVNCWRKQLQGFYDQNRVNNDDTDLYKVFNRGFSDAYLTGDIDKNMFIDNPRDNSIKQFSGITEDSANKKLLAKKNQYYEDKAIISTNVRNKIKKLRVEKIPLKLTLSGSCGAPLTICVKTPYTSFVVISETNLTKTGPSENPDQQNRKPTGGPDPMVQDGKKAADGRNNNHKNKTNLNYNVLLKRLSTLNNSEYYIKKMDLKNLEKGLFISFKSLNLIKKRISFTLNGSKKAIAPVELPFLKRQPVLIPRPSLGVLISSRKDLYLCDNSDADIFFQLPSGFENECVDLTNLFLKNKRVVPWFPSVLMGANYDHAVKFLQQVQPGCIVTDNAGIAYEAYKNKIPWIAGPFLNMVNSFGLLCLKEKFNCSGAFISNEISKRQIKKIIPPGNFKLYYSIYHPILLLTSAQCLLHQVIGCEKNKMDEQCIQSCNKSASITNLKDVPLLIKKTKGNYHCIYNNINYLNTDIVHDFSNFFSSFFIDLRNIETDTIIGADKIRIITLFNEFLSGKPDSANKLKQMIHPSTNVQYIKGI